MPSSLGRTDGDRETLARTRAPNSWCATPTSTQTLHSSRRCSHSEVVGTSTRAGTDMDLDMHTEGVETQDRLPCALRPYIHLHLSLSFRLQLPPLPSPRPRQRYLAVTVGHSGGDSMLHPGRRGEKQRSKFRADGAIAGCQLMYLDLSGYIRFLRGEETSPSVLVPAGSLSGWQILYDRTIVLESE